MTTTSDPPFIPEPFAEVDAAHREEMRVSLWGSEPMSRIEKLTHLTHAVRGAEIDEAIRALEDIVLRRPG